METANLPTLSVVIPNYNHGKYLAGCIAAVLKESVAPMEIIFIDDGSADDSVAIMEEIAKTNPSIKIFRNSENQGCNYTVNRGMDLARGDYVFIQPADDEVQPGIFAKSLKLLAQYPQAGLCAGICRFRDMGTGLTYHLGVGIAEKSCYLPPAQILELAQQGRLILFTSTMIFRRDALLEAAKFRADLRWHADWFCGFVVSFRYGICFIPEALTEFRVYSTSFSKKGMKKMKDQLALLRHMVDCLGEEAYRDVEPVMRKGSVLAPFAKEMLWVLMTSKKYWKYLTLNYFRQAFWWIFRIEAKKFTPRFIAKWYFKLGGYNKLPTGQNEQGSGAKNGQ